MNDKDMIQIDGTQGGGQLLRTALSLSLCTGTPFRMSGIRAGRSKPGLMRQHLTAVEAAAQISDAIVTGAVPGSQEISFRPKEISGGNYHFAIGTAGSTTLVLQTLLPALWHARTPSTLRLEGGTHNPLAPPADFLTHAFAPLVGRMNAPVAIALERHGFFPAGGGELNVQIAPSGKLNPLSLLERGTLRRTVARALISAIPSSVADRELRVAARYFGLAEDALEHRSVRPAVGPGNALMIVFEFDEVTEIFTGFGERGVSAEQVAERICREARIFLDSDVAVGPYLADQLLLPMALAGGGEFSTLAPTNHARTNAALIEKFLPVEFEFRADGKERWVVAMS
jgi:RNA 3'-terminal phosphate cyclase (ATP)